MKTTKLFWTVCMSLILSVAIFTAVSAHTKDPVKPKKHKKVVYAYFELNISGATFQVKGHGSELTGTIDTYIEGCYNNAPVTGTVTGTYSNNGSTVNVDIKVSGKPDFLYNGTPAATNNSGFPPLGCYQ